MVDPPGFARKSQQWLISEYPDIVRRAAPMARWCPQVLRTVIAEAGTVLAFVGEGCAGHGFALGGVVAQALRARSRSTGFRANRTPGLTRSWSDSRNANEFAQAQVAVASAWDDCVPLGPRSPVNGSGRRGYWG